MALLESEQMEVGTPMIPFRLKEAHGGDYDSAELESKLALIAFTCNHCPYAKASWPVLIELSKKYAGDGLTVIAINPNNNPDYPEDRFEAMRPYAEQHGIRFPYLFDADQSVAKAYGAVCTPDPFLFTDGELFYHGRLNDNWQNPAAVKEPSMELFIEAALGRRTAPEKSFPSMGCSIKWVR